MKTPIEKASAVRSGGSSIASRRRNAARNINYLAADRRRFAQICVYLRPKPALLKTLQRFRFVIIRIEHGEQFRDHTQILNSIRQVQQLELPALATDRRVVGNQLADTTQIGRAHV